MIIYSFTGFLFGNERININYNIGDANASAIRDNGATAKPAYINYTPNINEGSLVWQQQVGNTIYKATWKKIYPFVNIITETVPPLPPNPITATFVKTDETSFLASDGTLTITASNGTSPYQYSLDNVTYQSSNLFTNLAPGLYTFYVKDNTGAIYNNTFTIIAALAPPPVTSPAIDDVIALSGAELTIQNAYKRVVVVSKFGNVPSIITNGDFETYDGQNWEFWVKYGGINLSRVQRSIINADGVAVPIENYAIKFNERANAGKYIQHSDIPVQLGDTFKFNYNVGKTANTGVSRGVFASQYGITIMATYRNYYLFKLRIKIGNYYLYNQDNGSNYQWVNQLATVNHPIDNGTGDLNSFTFSFSTPPAPVTGAMIIQLFGFQKVQSIETDETKTPQGTVIAPTYRLNELAEYMPIEFDALKASKTSQSSSNDITGITSISDNLRNFSQSPEPFELLFGDRYIQDVNAGRTNSDLDTLYAIQYNGDYTKTWYEFNGNSSKPYPFGQGLALAILQYFQKPFKLWANGGLKLRYGATRFSYLNLFSFNVPNQRKFNDKLFAILGCDIDIKTNQLKDVTLTEVFDKPVKANNVSIPTGDDTPLPPINQDPTNVIQNGIFTQEFTEEFN